MDINEEDTYKKWSPIIESLGVTGSKTDWLSQYANYHEEAESNIMNTLYENTPVSEFPMMPISRRVYAQTLGHDLVAVKPLSTPVGLSKEERERIEAETKQINRDSKIGAIIEDSEYVEKKVEEHPDYKVGGLLYLDFKYNNKDEKNKKDKGDFKKLGL